MSDSTITKEEFFENALDEIKRACVDKKHPYRYVALASGSDQNIGLRNVVLREFNHAKEFILFTDKRSNKIVEIQKNGYARMLFYHPKKRTQISIFGELSVHYEDSFSESYLKGQDDYSLKSYSTIQAPGSIIEHPEDAWNYGKVYFAVLSFNAIKCDILQLGRQGHLRMQAEMKDQEWRKNWVVP